jgi:hypothetical protein
VTLLRHWLGQYTLDEAGKPVPAEDTIAWARWIEQNPKARRVGDDTVGPYRVSTIFLGLDHGFGESDVSVLWETMIFAVGTNVDNFMWRYTSLDTAKAGHAKAVELLRERVRKLQS